MNSILINILLEIIDAFNPFFADTNKIYVNNRESIFFVYSNIRAGKKRLNHIHNDWAHFKGETTAAAAAAASAIAVVATTNPSC